MKKAIVVSVAILIALGSVACNNNDQVVIQDLNEKVKVLSEENEKLLAEHSSLTEDKAILTEQVDLLTRTNEGLVNSLEAEKEALGMKIREFEVYRSSKPLSAVAYPEIRLLPENESSKDENLKNFIDDFLKVIEKKDVEGLKAFIYPNLKYSFGINEGYEGFLKYWKLDESPDQSEFWEEMREALELGGVFSGEDYYFAPYVFETFPGEGSYDVFNAYEFVACIAEDVKVYAEPSINARVLRTLDYNLVKLSYWQEKITDGIVFKEIQLSNGEVGFVESKYLRSPIDYRVGIEKSGDSWRVNFFVAGD